MISRIEQARLDIIAEFSLITPGNGYRNDVGGRVYGAIRDSSLVPLFPEIGVVIPSGSLKADNNCISFDETATAYVVGKFEAPTDSNPDSSEFQESQESLINDFSMVWANILLKYLNTEEHWCVVSMGTTIIPSPDFGTHPNRGIVEMSFQIALNSQTPAFT